MEINHWARLVSAKLVKKNIENPASDLLIIGHYGGFSTYKQDGWSGYAMTMSDFISEIAGINDIIGGPGILVVGTGPVRTIALDGTSGGGTNFNVQPQGVIQVSLNEGTPSGDTVTVTNLDTIKIYAQNLASGLNWAGSWVLGKNVGFAQDDVVWYEDPNSGVYYTYWAYNGDVPPDDPTGTAPLPSSGEASNLYWARLGLEGPTGSTGLSTGIMKLYQWSTTVPTVTPADQSAYTWATGAFTNPSDVGIWSQSIPDNPVADEILWEITQQFTQSPAAAVVAVSWAGSVPKPIAYYGTAGDNGKTVLSGPGAPDNALGEDGDFYIDTSSAEYTMYGPKVSGNWTTNPTKNLKGDDGTAGSVTYSVAGTAAGTLGVTGDYYIDTTSTNYTMYGPKLNDNSWSGATALDLKGPQGPAGAAGQAIAIGFRQITQASPASNMKILLGNTGSDLGTVLECDTSSAPMIILIPASTTMPGSTYFPVGGEVIISRNNVGSLQIQPEAGSNVTIYSADNMTYLRSQYSMATLIKKSNTQWYLIGDISPY